MSYAVPYRRISAKIVRQVIDANPAKRLQELRRTLRKSYPFGPPEGDALRLWNLEVAKQLEARKRPRKCAK
ncbi:hypothetical protein GCM10028804_53800 [Larkinella terrae]